MVFLLGLVSVLPNGFAWLVYFLCWSSRFVGLAVLRRGVAGLPVSHVAQYPFSGSWRGLGAPKGSRGRVG